MGLKIIGDEEQKERDPNTPASPPGLRVIEEPPPPQKTTTMQAIGEGVSQGLSYGGADELAAAIKGQDDIRPGETREDAIKRLLTSHQESIKAAGEEHPLAYYGSQAAGGVAGALAMPVQAVGRIPGAVQGAIEGGVQGFNEGTTTGERVSGAAIGGAGGAIGGLISPEMGKIGSVISRRLGKEVWERVAPLLGGPGGERQVARALEAAGLSPQEAESIIQEGVQRGQPVALGDIGQGPTGRLGRAASDTNPEAQQVIGEAVDTRNAERVDRFRNFMFKQAPGYGTAASERDVLLNASRKANKANYDAAYANAPDVWDKDLIDMTTSPAVQQAMKDVEAKSANRAVAEGGKSTLKNPFKFDPVTGEASLKDPNMRPSLEFWDQVQRNLREQSEDAGKGHFGTKSSAATDINDIRRNLNSKLDDLSPDFKKARGEALTFFKASDSIDLGAKLASDAGMSSESFEKGLAALAKMPPADRRLAQVGYIDALSHRAGTGSNNADVARTLTGSPNDKAVQLALFGPDKAKNMDAFQKAEGLMQLFSNRSLGGPNTAQRLIDAAKAAGISGTLAGAGGFAMGANAGDDEKLYGGAGGVVGGLAGLVYAGGKNHFSQKAALNVAKYLVSQSADDRAKVYSMMQASPAVREAISAVAGRLGGMLGADVAPDETGAQP